MPCMVLVRNFLVKRACLLILSLGSESYRSTAGPNLISAKKKSHNIAFPRHNGQITLNYLILSTCFPVFLRETNKVTLPIVCDKHNNARLFQWQESTFFYEGTTRRIMENWENCSLSERRKENCRSYSCYEFISETLTLPLRCLHDCMRCFCLLSLLLRLFIIMISLCSAPSHFSSPLILPSHLSSAPRSITNNKFFPYPKVTTKALTEHEKACIMCWSCAEIRIFARRITNYEIVCCN